MQEGWSEMAFSIRHLILNLSKTAKEAQSITCDARFCSVHIEASLGGSSRKRYEMVVAGTFKRLWNHAAHCINVHTE
jgi:hypothetical protein